MNYVLELIVIQVYSKGNGEIFKTDWNGYKVGFGTIREQNYWKGLEAIHQITKAGSYGLNVILTHTNGTEVDLKWNSFSIGSEADKYIMSISDFDQGTSTLPDLLKDHDGMKFTTTDQDNDILSTANCADANTGTGWWYHQCMSSHLNDGHAPWYGEPMKLSQMILFGKEFVKFIPLFLLFK